MLMATTAAAIVRGIPGAVEEMANDWIENASMEGFPNEFDTYLFYAAEAVAVIVIFIGWVLLSYVTVFVIRWIF
jgi:hypothetical protein